MNLSSGGRAKVPQGPKPAFLLGGGGPAEQRALPLRALAGLLLAISFLLSIQAAAQAAKYPQTIVFMTDFGVVDDSVAICRGVMYSIMPEVRVVDLSQPGNAVLHSRWREILIWGDALLSGWYGFRSGDRSDGGEHAEGDRGEVEARAIFCVAR